MNKLVPTSLGVVGAGGLGVGGFSIFKSKVAIVDPYREKYKFAILKDGDAELWEKKFKSLTGASPTHETLRRAVGTLEKETNRKIHHKQGCQEIYDSSIKDGKYFDDFKKYCSRNNEDVIGTGWIEDATDDVSPLPPETPSKWDTKLTSLMGKKDKETIQALKDLAGKLTSSSHDKAKRDELKAWCNGQKSEIFLGEEDAFTKSIRSYCVE